MSRSAPSGAQPISLDDLVALNDELTALVRAGVPLDSGLDRLASDSSGRLARVTARIADEMRRGASLPQALGAVADDVPATYRAVVEAGLRSGRLPDALEMLSEQSRSAAELRRAIGLSLIYPMIVLVVAWLLFTLVLKHVIWRFAAVYDDLGVRDHWWMTVLNGVASAVDAWGWLVPAGVAVLVVLWIVNRWTSISVFGLGGGIGWVPGVRRVLHNERLAHFNGLLAVLLDSGVPLPDALPLSAQSVGDRRLTAGVDRLADEVRRGEPLGRAVQNLRFLPPFMRWMIGAGAQQSALVPALRQLAEMYRQRARYQADWFQLVFPVAMTVGLGGSIVLFYTLALFVPLTNLLRGLAIDY